MVSTKIVKNFLPAMMLALFLPLSAQQDQDAQPAVPTPIPGKVTTVPEPVSPMDEMSGIDEDESMLYRLQGGGEVVGELIKETPERLFIDIGPNIIDIPVSAVSKRIRLSEMPTDEDVKTGQGTGVYDEETGSVVFRSRPGTGEILSQQQILENVKKGVVVVSNPSGLGTGWLINRDGQLITNHHVIGNETYQTVTLFVKEGGQWEKKKIDNCKVEAFSSLLDIAMVQLDMDQVREENIELHPVEIAEEGELEAGDIVYAVGNPGMGRIVLEHTISEGIVSSLQRNFNDVIYLQTTAPVNPGNSGGPLVNQRGEVVGLVTLKAIFQEGVAFALPVEYIHHFLRHIKAYAVDDMNRNKGYRYHRPQ